MHVPGSCLKKGGFSMIDLIQMNVDAMSGLLANDVYSFFCLGIIGLALCIGIGSLLKGI